MPWKLCQFKDKRKPLLKQRNFTFGLKCLLNKLFGPLIKLWVCDSIECIVSMRLGETSVKLHRVIHIQSSI